MRPTLRLHVGLPKAGSTSLQSAVAATSNVLFLGKAPGKRFLNPQISNLHARDRASLGRGDARRRTIRDGVRGRAGAERLGCNAAQRRDTFSSIGSASRGRAVSPAQIVENFRRLLDARIEVFLVVREQLSFRGSYYAHLVFTGVELGYSEFLAFVLVRRQNPGRPPESIGARLAHNRLHGSAARSGWSFCVEDSEFARHGHAVSRLLRRHLAGLIDGQSGQRDASPETPADPFAVEPELMAVLLDRVASSNSVLQRQEPAYDWASLGYRMPQPERTAL